MLLNVGSGGGAAAAAPSGGAGAAAAGGDAPAEEKKEEKKEEGMCAVCPGGGGTVAALLTMSCLSREGGIRRRHGLRSVRLGRLFPGAAVFRLLTLGSKHLRCGGHVLRLSLSIYSDLR